MSKKKTKTDLLRTLSVNSLYGTKSPQCKRLIKLDLVARAATWNLSTNAHWGSADQQVIRVTGRASVMCLHEQSCVVSGHKIVFWSHFVTWLVGERQVSLFICVICFTVTVAHRNSVPGDARCVVKKMIQFHLISLKEYNLSFLNDSEPGLILQFLPGYQLCASTQTQFHIETVETN